MIAVHRLRRRRRVGAVAGAFTAAVAANAALAADPANGRLLASQCGQCHGASGFESLAGEEYAEIVEEMLEMARPSEIGSIMKHQAKGYTRAQVMLIAAYFASLPKTHAAGTPSAPSAAPAMTGSSAQAAPGVNGMEE
jgi:sulfide dehydrogenase cytochrome subunit